jgi:hypothetical protein
MADKASQQVEGEAIHPLDAASLRADVKRTEEARKATADRHAAAGIPSPDDAEALQQWGREQEERRVRAAYAGVEGVANPGSATPGVASGGFQVEDVLPGGGLPGPSVAGEPRAEEEPTRKPAGEAPGGRGEAVPESVATAGDKPGGAADAPRGGKADAPRGGKKD